MKNVIFKKIWLAVFTFVLVAMSLGVNAQTTDSNAPNASHAIATQYGVTAYEYGTFDTDNAFIVLNDELNDMRSAGTPASEYRYYWYVAVDVKRFSVPVEDALLKNLERVQQEYGTSSQSLKNMYNEVVSLIQ
ncbi:MAG: hypothetical protein AAF573_06195 [Bacteroidota bacterium]